MDQELKKKISIPDLEVPTIETKLKLKISDTGNFDFEATNFNSDVADALLLTATAKASERQSAISQQVENSYRAIIILVGLVAFVFLALSSFYLTLKIKELLRSNENGTVGFIIQ